MYRYKKSAFKALMVGLLTAPIAQNSLALNKDDIAISGFATLGLSVSDTPYITDTNIDNDFDLFPDSVIGLQFDAPLNDSTTFTLQMMARGDNSISRNSKDDFDLNTEWAYLTHRFSDHHAARIGRMRNPIFMLSQSLDVGYTYPWVRPPVEVYSRVPDTQTQGIDYTYTNFIGDWQFMITPTLGATTETEEGKAENYRSLNFNISNDVHTIHAGRTNVTLSIPEAAEGIFAGIQGADYGINGFPGKLSDADKAGVQKLLNKNFVDIDINFTGLGYIYNDGRFLVMSEITRTEADGAFLADTDAGYLTFGITFGNWQPHITFAKANTRDDKIRKAELSSEWKKFVSGNKDITVTPPFPPGAQPIVIATINPVSDTISSSFKQIDNERESLTLGVRWNYSRNTALKFDAQYLTNFGDTDGFMVINSDPAAQEFRPSDDKGVMIYRLSLTAVF